MKWFSLLQRGHTPSTIAAFSAGALALTLYVTTAAPGIVELFDDTLEFQVVLPTFGIAHPTGYPLYVLLGGLWSRVLFPLGEWAWRVNLFSATTGAVAIGVITLLGARLARVSSPWHLSAGLGAAAAFGFGPVWWSQNTEAEVYALHILFVALILYLTLAFLDTHARQHTHKQAQNSLSPAVIRRVTWLCLAIGLGLTHHRTVLLLLPGIALVLLWQAPNLIKPARHWFGWLAALLSPLLLYLWIPWRAAMGVRDLHGSYENTWQGFWDHVLARRYTAFFSENPLMVERTFEDWLHLFIAQMGWLAVALALIGLLAHPLRMRRIEPGWALIGLTLIANLIFALNYHVGDVEVFLLPAFLAIALFTAIGLGSVVHLLLGRAATPQNPGPQNNPQPNPPLRIGLGAGVLVLLTAGVAFGIGGRGAFDSRAQEWGAHDHAYLTATVDFPPASRVIGLEGEITGLSYMQLAHDLGRNAQGIVANRPAERQAAIARAVEQGAPVFITREVEDIAHRYRFSGAGPLVRVWPAQGEMSLPPLARQVDYALEGAPLVLEAATVNRRTLPGGPRLELILDWRLRADVDSLYKVSLRVLHNPAPENPAGEPQPLHDSRGQPIVADVFPLHQVAFTSQWPVDETVRDVHYLPLPEQTPGDAFLQMIIYDGETIEEVGRWEILLIDWLEPAD